MAFPKFRAFVDAADLPQTASIIIGWTWEIHGRVNLAASAAVALIDKNKAAHDFGEAI